MKVDLKFAKNNAVKQITKKNIKNIIFFNLPSPHQANILQNHILHCR